MIKHLVIVDIEHNSDKANKIIGKLNENATLLYLNNNIINDKLNYLLLDHLFKPEYATKIDRHVRYLAKNWYKTVEKDFIYFGLSLPQLVENKFLKIWPLLLKIEILDELIKKEKPSKISILTEFIEDIEIIKEISKNKKLNMDYKFFKKSYNLKFKSKIKNQFYNLITKVQNELLKFYLKRKRKRNILFLGNIRQTSNLLLKLKENKKNVIIRGGENLGRGLFSKYCSYYLTFRSFSNKRIKRILKREKSNFLIKWNKLEINDKLKKDLFYKISLFNILKPFLKEIILEDFIGLIKYINIIKTISPQIDIVVTHNDVISFEKTVIKSANKLNIPTVTMIEGFLPVKQIRKGNMFIPFSAQIMALHSIEQKKAIKRKGISEDRLVVTGYPYFDRYFENNSWKKSDIYERYNIPLNKKIILYVGERYTKNKSESSIWAAFTEEQYKLVYKELFSALNKFEDLFLIIKKHPSGSLDENIIKSLANEIKFNRLVITSDLDVDNIINASYAVITRLSTMGLEAMFLRKPVIIMDTYFDSKDNFDYTQFNAALHVKKPGELKNILSKLLNKDTHNQLKKNMDKFVRYNYSFMDNKASIRMVNLIENKTKNIKQRNSLDREDTL